MKQMRQRVSIGALIIGNLLAVGLAPSAMASSHREAPFITRHPKVDATDFYMFRSYEAGRNDYITLIANYVPLQDVYGGPNYFTLDPDALYEIHIDNNGDAREDLTFQFRFRTPTRTPSSPSAASRCRFRWSSTAARSTASTRPASTCAKPTPSTVVRGNRRSGTRAAVTNADGGATIFDKPIDNIGTKSIPDYAAYAAKHVYDDQHPRLRDAGAHVRRPAQGIVRRQPRRDVRPHQLSRRRRSVRPERREAPRTTWPTRTSRRSTRSADRLPPERHRRRPGHRRLDQRQPAPGPPAQSAPGAASAPRSKAARGCRSRASACRWSTKS